MKRLILAALLAGAAAGPALAAEACRPDPRVEQVAADWLAKRPQPLRYIATGQGTCFRQQLIRRLMPVMGPVVGYKVGAYTKSGQAVYNTDRPVVATLLKRMMLPVGRPVPADYGVTPLWEADFLLVVKDAGINTATTREEAYRHLRGYQPFIELADRGYVPDNKLTLDQWKALNVSGRAGLAGKEVRLPQTKAGFDAPGGHDRGGRTVRPGGEPDAPRGGAGEPGRPGRGGAGRPGPAARGGRAAEGGRHHQPGQPDPRHPGQGGRDRDGALSRAVGDRHDQRRLPLAQPLQGPNGTTLLSASWPMSARPR